MASKYLSKADFLAGITCKPVDFEVSELGIIRIRSLSAEELNELGQKYQNDGFAMAMACIDTGLVEPHLEPDELQELRKASARFMLQIGQRIMELSGAGDQVSLEKKVGNGS